MFNNLFSQKVKLDLAIDNPNDKIITFTGVSGHIKYNGKELGTLQVDKRIKLPKNDTTVLQGIVIDIDPFVVGSELIDLLFSDDKLHPIIVTGSIHADGFAFPFTKSINLQK